MRLFFFVWFFSLFGANVEIDPIHHSLNIWGRIALTKGIEPIFFSYNACEAFSHLELQLNANLTEVLFKDSNGAQMRFKRKHKKNAFYMDLSVAKSLSNMGTNFSSCSNPISMQVEVLKHSRAVVLLPNGGKRIYGLEKQLNEAYFNKNRFYLLLLREEVLPSKMRLKYDYEQGVLSKITLFDPSSTQIIDSVTFTHQQESLIAWCYGKEALRFERTNSGYVLFIHGLFEERFSKPYEGIRGFYETAQGDWKGFRSQDGFITEVYLKDGEGKEFLHEVYKKKIYENVHLVCDSKGIFQVVEHDGYRVLKCSTLDKKNTLLIEKEMEDKRGVFSDMKEFFLKLVGKNAYQTQVFFHHPTKALLEKKLLLSKGSLLQAELFFYDNLDLIRSELYQDLEKSAHTALDWDEKTGNLLQGKAIQTILNNLEEIDGGKKVKTRELSNGILEKYFYDSSGKEIEMELFLDKKLIRKETISYDDFNRVKERTQEDPEYKIQKTTQYSYNEIGQVVQQSQKTLTRLLQSREAFYDKYYNLIEERELNGHREIQNRTFYSYDDHSRRTQKKTASGEGVEFYYDSKGHIIAQLDLLTQIRTDFSYDSRGLLTQTTTPRGSEKIYYDRYKRPIECHDARGGVRKQRWNSQGKIIEVTLEKSPTQKQTIRYRYDSLGHLREEIDPLGHSIRYENDLKGNKKWIKMEGYEGRFFYNPLGIMTQKHIQNKKTQEDFHDPLGRVIRTNLEGKESTFIYNGFDIIEENRFDGTKVCYVYDEAGLLIKEKITKGGVSATKIYDYDASQNLVKVEFVEKGQKIFRTFDLKKRVIEEKIEDIQNKIYSHKKHLFDDFGNLTEIHLLIDGKWAITKKEYDLWGRETVFIDPLGNTTRFVYENLSVGETAFLEKKTKIFPNGSKEIYWIDPFHEVVSLVVCDLAGTTIRKENYTTDLKGNLTKLEVIYQTTEGEKGLIYEFTYDASSKLLKKVVDAESLCPQTYEYSYDTQGRLDKLKKPSGVTLFYLYTEFDEIQRIFSSDHSVDYIYIYDEKQNLVEVMNVISGQSTFYTYNELGLVVNETLENQQQLQISYDSNLEINGFHFSKGGSIYMESTAFGVNRIIRETLQKERLEFVIHKTMGGDAVKKIDLPFEMGSIDYFYDVDGRVEKKEDFGGVDRIEKKSCFGSPLRRGVLDPSGAFTVRYSYNYNDELENSSDDPIEKIYNGVGVPDFFSGSKVYYDSKLFIKNLQGRYLDYDPQGNLFSQKESNSSTIYRYDALDRLIEADLKDTKIFFSYDFKHRLIQKKTVSKRALKTIDYIYQNLIEVGSIDHETKDLLEFRTVLFEKDHRSAFTLMVEKGERLALAYHDIFRNLTGLFDPKTNEWLHLCRFSPFGKKFEKISKIDCPWSYKEARYQKELSFFIFGMRFYDSYTHQFLSKDPLGEKFGYFGHRFCNNNPLKYEDPSGMAPIDSISIDLSPFIQSFLNHLYERKDLSWDSLIGMSKGEVYFPLEAFSKVLLESGSYLAKTMKAFLQKERTIVDKRAQKAFHETQQELKDKKNPSNILEDALHPLIHKIYPDGFFSSTGQNLTFDLFTNGVGNTLNDAKESAKTIANHIQKEVFLIYNSSKSLFHDVYRAAKNKISRAKGDVVHLLENIANAILDDPSSNLRVWAHSEGALNTALAFEQFPEEKKQRLIVHTFGAAELIPKCFGGKVINYVADRDAVSMGANMHIFMTHSRSKTTITFTQPIKGITVPVHEIQNSRTGHRYNVVFLHSKNKIEHFFKGESYQWALQLAQGYEKAA